MHFSVMLKHKCCFLLYLYVIKHAMQAVLNVDVSKGCKRLVTLNSYTEQFGRRKKPNLKLIQLKLESVITYTYLDTAF